MDSTVGTVALLIVIVAALAIGFIGFWIRDKKRADEEATDPERIAPKGPGFSTTGSGPVDPS